jgi:hypothetical protein
MLKMPSVCRLFACKRLMLSIISADFLSNDKWRLRYLDVSVAKLRGRLSVQVGGWWLLGELVFIRYLVGVHSG